jgi:hypothetical protein
MAMTRLQLGWFVVMCCLVHHLLAFSITNPLYLSFYAQAHLKAQHFKVKREMAARRQKLQSSSTLRNFKPSFMQQDVVECDWANEETCYDDSYNAVGCANYFDGGCPCPTGQEKCGYDVALRNPGYCTDPEFCCEADEELCSDADYNPTGCASIASGGCPCPSGQTKCGGVPEWNIAGWCSEFCCEEETCYDDETWKEIGCATFSEGCACPEGETKCGASEYWAGICTTLCCADDEETCYDDSYSPTECKSIAEGGCPCSGDQVKCYAYPEYNYAGICVDECCTDEQEACYDYEDGGKQTCADIASGGCPCTEEGEIKCGASDTYAGYCTQPEYCCAEDEELCYTTDDWYAQPDYCAPVASGGCPCPAGESKCGAMPEINYAGYCASLCCEEQSCYDWTSGEITSCATWDEQCPTGMPFDVLKQKAMGTMDENMMKKHAADFNKIKATKSKMLSVENSDPKGIEKMVRAEEIAIFRKQSGSKKSFGKNDVPAFMMVY